MTAAMAAAMAAWLWVDAGSRDVLALLVGASRAAQSAGRDPEVAGRVLAIVFHGLRPHGGTVRGTS